MRIGINLTTLFPGKIGGAEQYTRNIIKKFAEYKKDELYLFLNDEAIKTFKQSTHMHLIEVSLLKDIDLQLKGYIDFYNIDVWFCPLLFLDPIDCPIESVTTIFDIQQYYFPENFEPEILRLRYKKTRETVQKTSKLITVSEFSKQTLLDNHKVDADKIVVTYLDSDESFYLPLEKNLKAKFKRKLPKDYILFPAAMWPHKNHITLLKAFKIVKEKYKLDLKLVFTGAKEKETEKIRKYIEENNLKQDIIYLGYLEQDEMRYVFRLANMLVFPTLFEGFPLPIVEAMRSDIPIICSNTTCLPEMAKDAALLIDPLNPKEIASAIKKVYSNKELRRKLIENGKRQRNEYSWDFCASQAYDEIQKVYVKKDVIKKKDSFISIVVPVLNNTKRLKDTVDSILNQSYKNFEVIVIGSFYTYRNTDDRVKYIFNRKLKDKASLVNAVIKQAKGNVVGILEVGDYLEKTALKDVNDCFKTHDVSLVYGKSKNDTKEICAFDYDTFIREYNVNRMNYFIKKDCYLKHPLNPRYKMYPSYDLWIKTQKDEKLLFIPKTISTLSSEFICNEENTKEILDILKDNNKTVPRNWLTVYLDCLNLNHNSRLEMIKKIIPYGLKDVLSIYREKSGHSFSSKKGKSETSSIWYSDGWISKEYSTKLSLNGNEERVKIKCINHNRFKNLKIAVKVDDIKKTFIFESEMEIEMEIELPDLDKKEVSISIAPNKYIIPSRFNVSDDRKLSVILKEIKACR